jgi:hypothetical protein
MNHQMFSLVVVCHSLLNFIGKRREFESNRVITTTTTTTTRNENCFMFVRHVSNPNYLSLRKTYSNIFTRLRRSYCILSWLFLDPSKKFIVRLYSERSNSHNCLSFSIFLYSFCKKLRTLGKSSCCVGVPVVVVVVVFVPLFLLIVLRVCCLFVCVFFSVD